MTTFAQLESLLGTLPSDVVGHIHEYTNHPIAELFKVATRSGQILLRHPSIRRFPRAMGMSFTCHMAYLTNDDALYFLLPVWLGFHGGIKPNISQTCLTV